MSIKIADRIAFLRKKKGITQEELARRLNVTNQSVSKSASSWQFKIFVPTTRAYM